MLEILYDDAQLVVCVKPAGVAAQGEAPNAMPRLLSAQLGCPAVYPVHRLDQIVGGVMVYAKTQPSAAALSRQMQSGEFQKEYLAVLRGAPVLLLDEATSALDEATEQRMLQNLMHSGRVQTCVLITHRAATAERCRRRYALRGTRLTEEEP